MSDEDNYTFNDDNAEATNETENNDYVYEFSEEDPDDFSEPVIIVDDFDTSLEVSNTAQAVTQSINGFTFTAASELTDGKVEVFHLDDEGNEHSQILDLSSPELSPEEAKELTKTIRTQTNVLYLLIARAHAGKAHIALGYRSFEEYIKQEFNYSKSYAYKLLDQAKIIEAIEEVMPEGTQVYVSDATARGLKASMSDFVPELQEKVRDLAPDEAAEVMEELVQEYRERREEEKNNVDDEFGDEESGGEHRGEGGGGEYSGDYDIEDYEEEGEDEDAFDGEDGATVRRRYELIYNLYAALANFPQMPPNDVIIKTIPQERQPQVTAYLEPALTWLQNFKEDWEREVVNAENNDTDNNDNDENNEFDEDE